jgi:glyoxylase-like metal-dependent hydrolase (beta-lactamase superfamily II)
MSLHAQPPGNEAAQGSAPATSGTGVETLRVQGNVYLIAGAGGNIAVQVGPDGVVVVDTGSGAHTAAVLAAIKTLSDQPIRFVVNTGGEADHVGGNEAISKAGRPLSGGGMFSNSGVPIFANEDLLGRMSAPTGQQSPYPVAAWPTDTYLDKMNMYLNAEAIQMVHQPAAHGDGDSTVFFRRSDVVVTGDIFDPTRFPVIDVAHGGSIQGEIAALNRLVDLAVPPTPLTWQDGGTRVIPGHGRICEQAELVEYRDMVTIIRDVIQDQIARGLTLAQVQAAAPTKGYTKQYGATTGPWTTAMFVEAIYQSLTAKK